MLVKALDKICSFSKVGYYLLYVILLRLEKKTPLMYCTLCTSVEATRSDFEVSLLARDFEESLTGTIWYPDLVGRMELLRTSITSTLLLISPAVFLFTMLPHQS